MEEIKTTERWVPARYIRPNGIILDFKGLYEVSDLGRIRSLNYRRSGETKVMSLCTNKDPYGTIVRVVTLRKDDKPHTLLVHRIVLSSFNPESFRLGRIVNHKIERTQASCINELSNLEWSTQKDNTSTEHCKTLTSKTLTNHPTLSKRVRVINLTTNETIEYPSAMEAGRSLSINPKLPAAYISKCNGYCKKRNLHFEYIK